MEFVPEDTVAGLEPIPVPYHYPDPDEDDHAVYLDSKGNDKTLHIDTSAMFDTKRQVLSKDFCTSLLAHVTGKLFEHDPQLKDHDFGHLELKAARDEWFASLQHDDLGRVVANAMPTETDTVTAPAQMENTTLTFDTRYGAHAIRPWSLGPTPTSHTVQVMDGSSRLLKVPDGCTRIQYNTRQSKYPLEYKPVVQIGPSKEAIRGFSPANHKYRDGLVRAYERALINSLSESSDKERHPVFSGHDCKSLQSVVNSAAQEYFADQGLTADDFEDGMPADEEAWADVFDIIRSDSNAEEKRAALEYAEYFHYAYTARNPSNKLRLIRRFTEHNNADLLTKTFLASMPDAHPANITQMEYRQALRWATRIISWAATRSDKKFKSAKADSKVYWLKDNVRLSSSSLKEPLKTDGISKKPDAEADPHLWCYVTTSSKDKEEELCSFFLPFRPSPRHDTMLPFGTTATMEDPTNAKNIVG